MPTQPMRNEGDPSPVAILLRGINVGGRNRLPMADLRSMLSARGYTEVATYIQSGNVVCRPPASEGAPTTNADIAADVAEAIATDADLRVPVVVRTADELSAARGRCPFEPSRVDPKLLHAFFLASVPDAAAGDALDPARSPRDEFELVGAELWVYYRDGQAGTKLTIDYVERTLGVRATGRNWNTIVKLDDMLASIG